MKYKLQYFVNEVKFFGFVFNKEEMEPDPNYIKIIKELKILHTKIKTVK